MMQSGFTESYDRISQSTIRNSGSPITWLLSEQGIALLVALIALALFSLMALFFAFNATTGVRISDNYESEVQARFAARAGINHAREVLRGLQFGDLLVGPDGTYSTSPSYLAQARTYGFRNPLSWATARSLNILDPTSDVSAIPDDGLINTGHYGTSDGTVLIPKTGVAQTVTNPYGPGTITISRYFVRASDNNGEASDLAGDPSNNPFVEGDSTILVRSVGVAQTIREVTGSTVRRNSVAVFEVRLKQRQTFDLDAPLVIQGSQVLPSAPNMFNGNSFLIDGGSSNPGIATIDVNTGDPFAPTQQLSSQLAKNQENNIQGTGSEPSIQDITSTVGSNPDQALLLDLNYLYNFANVVVPQFADNVYMTSQSWSGGSAPDIGYYDYTQPPNAPGQRPKTTYVHGDLSISGNVEGGGLLVVTGKLSGIGRFIFNGLILVIGSGELDVAGLNYGFHGGVYVVKVENVGGTLSWGTPKFSISGNSNITIDSQAISMGVRMIPASELSFREVTSSMDP